MQRTHFQFAITAQRLARRWFGARSASKAVRAIALTCASSFMPMTAPTIAMAAPYVEFDVAPIAECRDITPTARILQHPAERLIEVKLPVSVRFHGASMDDVDELAIEINGASAGLRVHDFAPETKMFSDVSHEIETTTTTKKTRSLDASLGGTLPVPGVSDAVAHLTPSISGGLSDCDTATEKINRLPPKHAVVVSGTSLEGRGVFFKLKRYSQTSLEGVHELVVTFVAPTAWQRREIQVDCAARGERKMLWMKQDATIGRTSRMVQLVEMSARPIRQLVLKPAASDAPAPVATAKPMTEKTAAKPAAQWRSTLQKNAAVEIGDPLDEEPSPKSPAKKRWSSSTVSATKDG